MSMIRIFFQNIGNSQLIRHISFLWHWKNFFFLLRYPFYRVYHRWTGKFCGYSFTEYDDIEDGWKKAFGKELSKEIKLAGKASRKRLHKHLSWKKMIQWQQIKEKWGYLCLYASGTKEILDVLGKYEELSKGYCIYCGKPTKYKTTGYMLYLCDNCFDECVFSHCKVVNNEMLNEFKEFCLLDELTKGENN